MLKSGERLEDLQCRGLRIIQHERDFRFGTDAVLLANFVRAHARERVVDLGTGSGVIPLLLSAKTDCAFITGVEILPEAADRAARSVALNALEDRIRIICGDFRDTAALGRQSYHVAVSNPPYRKLGSGMVNAADSHTLSRHEVNCTLDELCAAACDLLVSKGRFCLVHQAQRLAEIVTSLRAHRLEPKKLRPVAATREGEAKLVLIEAVKDAHAGLKLLPALILDESHPD